MEPVGPVNVTSRGVMLSSRHSSNVSPSERTSGLAPVFASVTESVPLAVVVAPVQLSIQGTHVSIVVDAAALGDPAAFAWAAFTEIAKQADPNDAAWFPDLAPDLNLGAPFAIWPQ